MPRSFNPKAVVRFTYEWDKDNPITWLSRPLTMVEEEVVDEIIDRARAAMAAEKPDECYGLIAEAFTHGMIGWEAPEGFTLPPFSVQAMREVLSSQEFWSVVNQWTYAVGRPTVAQKKASSSPVPSEPAASAPSAAAASA